MKTLTSRWTHPNESFQEKATFSKLRSLKEPLTSERNENEVMLRSASIERENTSLRSESSPVIDWIDYVDRLVNGSEI